MNAEMTKLRCQVLTKKYHQAKNPAEKIAITTKLVKLSKELLIKYPAH